MHGKFFKKKKKVQLHLLNDSRDQCPRLPTPVRVKARLRHYAQIVGSKFWRKLAYLGGLFQLPPPQLEFKVTLSLCSQTTALRLSWSYSE